MIFISSDTNVWIDFMTIGKLELPFRLPYTYLMYYEAVENELLSPPDLKSGLTDNGLVPTDITIDEFFLAEEYGRKYLKLSVYDRIALAVAKNRNIILLTGDAALRKAARQENVTVIGTIAVLDQLWNTNLITESEYVSCMNGLLANNGKKVRLPKTELEARLRMFKKNNQ